MNRGFSLVFLSVGIVLVIYGLNSPDSLASSFSRLFKGTPTDETIWFLIGGMFSFCIGAAGLIFGPKPTWKRS